jgi:shikimate dehydrogenase
MRLTATTRVVGIIGEPIRHSLSPAIHNAAFEALGLDWAYLAFEVGSDQVMAATEAVRALGLEGLSVTMPHKMAVARHVDRLSPTAGTLGAVNTIVRRGVELVGDSTDGAGLIDALRHDEGFDPEGRKAVVLGAGGAARAVILALARAGAAQIVVVNRTRRRAEEAITLASRVARVGSPCEVVQAELIVNTTPVGMGGDVAAPIDPDLLSPGQLVIDLVYHPAVTPLVAAAKARGAAVASGIGVLVHQAAHQFRLWTGEDPPLEVMSAAALSALAHL